MQVFQPTVTFPNTPLDSLADIELLVGALFVLLFTVVYGTQFTWWRTRAGRGIFAVFTSLSVLFLSIVLSHILGSSLPIIRAVAYFLVPLSMSYLFYALWWSFWHGPSGISIQARDKAVDTFPRIAAIVVPKTVADALPPSLPQPPASPPTSPIATLDHGTPTGRSTPPEVAG